MQIQTLNKLSKKLLLILIGCSSLLLFLNPMKVLAAATAIDYCLKPPPGFNTYTPKDNTCNSGDRAMYVCPLEPELLNCTADMKAQQQAEIKAGEKTIWCISTKNKPPVKASKPYLDPVDEIDGSPSCPKDYFLSSVDLCWAIDGSDLVAAQPDGNCPSGTEAGTAHNNRLSAGSLKTGEATGKYPCGSGANLVMTSIDFGCRGKGNAIVDLLFAIIRFLSIGVGIIIVGSIIVSGIQYTASRGDPQTTANALKRVTNTAIALGIYILAYAILNWLIPAGLFK